MIFFTIGTHEPFDRMVECIDNIAGRLGKVEIVAQLSNTGYIVNSGNIKVLGFISPEEFNFYCKHSDFIVCHAGMGTIITGLELGKIVIVFPRLGDLKETRNNHQVATVKKLASLDLVYVANDENELEHLINAASDGKLRPKTKITENASEKLLNYIDNFIIS